MKQFPDSQLQSFPGRIISESGNDLVFQEFKDDRIRLKKTDLAKIDVDEPGGYVTITMPWFMAQKRGLE